MRILYDHQTFSLQGIGGVSRYYYELLKHFGQMDTCRPELVLGVHRNGYDFDSLPGVRVWGFQGLPSVPGKACYVLNELFSSAILPLRGQFDVYHATHYRQVRGARWKKLVVTHHDCAYERYPALFKRVEWIKQLRARLFEVADAITCPSAATRRDLHEFYEVPESKTFVVHHAVSQLDGPLERGIESICQRPFLLYVGSRASYKNFPALLHAFAVSGLQKDFDTVVVGGGEATDAEGTLLRELGLAECVRFVPHASDALVGALYGRARLLVYPSLYEGFGLPPLEAMSLGCAALVSRTSCLPEICRNAAFYFEVDSLDSFVCSLRSACFDESERSARIEEGKRLVTSYTWTKCAANVLAIYKH